MAGDNGKTFTSVAGAVVAVSIGATAGCGKTCDLRCATGEPVGNIGGVVGLAVVADVDGVVCDENVSLVSGAGLWGGSGATFLGATAGEVEGEAEGETLTTGTAGTAVTVVAVEVASVCSAVDVVVTGVTSVVT